MLWFSLNIFYLTKALANRAKPYAKVSVIWMCIIHIQLCQSNAVCIFMWTEWPDKATVTPTLPMRSKHIVSSVNTKLRLQYRSLVGGNFINLRCHPSHDVAARCDQGLKMASLFHRGTSFHMAMGLRGGSRIFSQGMCHRDAYGV